MNGKHNEAILTTHIHTVSYNFQQDGEQVLRPRNALKLFNKLGGVCGGYLLRWQVLGRCQDPFLRGKMEGVDFIVNFVQIGVEDFY